MKKLILAVICFIFLSCNAKRIDLTSGLVIRDASIINPSEYRLNGTDSLNEAVITIEANDSEIDFNDAVLIGSNDKKLPSEFYGLGILIRNSENLVLKNLHVRGFKVAVRIQNSANIRITQSDISYNYRPRMYSSREREDVSDWLSYHSNEKNEWLRYGAAVYIEKSLAVQIDNCTMTGQQNGILSTYSDKGLYYNNSINFNSGLGIGLYHSMSNRIMHNKLDWNIRGYSHGIYNRGQDSAALLVYAQSSNNIIAYNSATHSGDGFFLWAGNKTMEDASGGANDNLLYGNDFSHAPTNGIEVTFSRNVIINNYVDECRYGVWGGYSYYSIIHNNIFLNSDYGVAIEHGQSNRISNNIFFKTKTAIQLWARANTPSWGYVNNRDTRSMNSIVTKNSIIMAETGYKIERSEQISLTENAEFNVSKRLAVLENKAFDDQGSNHLKEFPFDSTAIYSNWLNQVFSRPTDSLSAEYYVEPLSGGMNPFIKAGDNRGRQYMMITEWGPVDFKSPVAWLTHIDDDRYYFDLLGPAGNWKLVSIENAEIQGDQSGKIPSHLIVKRKTKEDRLAFTLIYNGSKIVTPFGEEIAAGNDYRFSFRRDLRPLNWQVSFYTSNQKLEEIDPIHASAKLKKVYAETSDFLEYRWWGKPNDKVPDDQFLTKAEAHTTFAKGRYRIGLTSDDGVILLLDGKEIYRDWTEHEPAHHDLFVDLDGEHHFTVYHFDKSGFATLVFTISAE